MKRTIYAVAGLLMLGGVAAAQPPQPSVGGPDAADMMRHEQDVTRDISTVLGLKPAQQPALQTWLASMHPPENMRHHGPRGAGEAPRTTPEMLQEKQARMAEMQQFEAGKLAATKRFYASLDGHQQQVFDALERLRHEGHGHHHDRHGPDGRHPAGPGMPTPSGAR